MSIDCKHEKVVRREDGSWHCDLCEEEFYHLGNLQRGKIQFTRMPEVATLRDQFAMAAMTWILAYPGRQFGASSDGAAAKICYQMADAMLEARK